MSSSTSSLPRLAPLYDVRQKVYALLNGTFHAAVILDIGRNFALTHDSEEENDAYNDVNNTHLHDGTTNNSQSEHDHDAFLYYVRFVEQDSRMDRWLSAHQLKERFQSRQQQVQQQQQMYSSYKELNEYNSECSNQPLPFSSPSSSSLSSPSTFAQYSESGVSTRRRRQQQQQQQKQQQQTNANNDNSTSNFTSPTTTKATPASSSSSSSSLLLSSATIAPSLSPARRGSSLPFLEGNTSVINNNNISSSNINNSSSNHEIHANVANVASPRTPTSSNNSQTNMKGSSMHGAHNVKVPSMRARKDSAFFSRTKNIHSICIGEYEIETWYFSPYLLARPRIQEEFYRAAHETPVTFAISSTESLNKVNEERNNCISENNINKTNNNKNNNDIKQENINNKTKIGASERCKEKEHLIDDIANIEATTTTSSSSSITGSRKALKCTNLHIDTSFTANKSNANVSETSLHHPKSQEKEEELEQPSSPVVLGVGPTNGKEWPIASKSFTLHLCPFCLEPFRHHMSVMRHLTYICLRHPPGNKIYYDPVRSLSVYEIDGTLEPAFCQHLALLSKLFLEHKALDHDMTPFLFYVLCVNDEVGATVLGYFSKEKQTPELYNLSCILVIPPYQGRGIGRFLIELSYELTKREGKVGSPEKPLSDLGEKLYYSYWNELLLLTIAAAKSEGHGVTIDYLVQATSMTANDVVESLQRMQLLVNNQLYLSQEALERCQVKQSHRETNSHQYIFFRHLLSWSPEMYEEYHGKLPSAKYVAWVLNEEYSELSAEQNEKLQETKKKNSDYEHEDNNDNGKANSELDETTSQSWKKKRIEKV